MKSFNPKATAGLGTARSIDAISTTVAAVLLVVTFILGLSGCSKEKSEGTSANLSIKNSSGQGVSRQSKKVSTRRTATTARLARKHTVPSKKEPVVEEQSSVTYTDSTYGVSFSYPRDYTFLTPGKIMQNSALRNWLPLNFVRPGGVTVAAIEMPGDIVSPLFNLGVNKNLTAEQCGQFATKLPQSGSYAPGQTAVGSIPSKVSIGGVEFSKVEDATEQTDIRYYHRFEPGPATHGGVAGTGTCYELAVRVDEPSDKTEPVDHQVVFNKMEGILASVKIKAEGSPTVTASVPAGQRP
jgi:hypothetical protein